MNFVQTFVSWASSGKVLKNELIKYGFAVINKDDYVQGQFRAVWCSHTVHCVYLMVLLLYVVPFFVQINNCC